jgi:two-component system LytT family response regulator
MEEYKLLIIDKNKLDSIETNDVVLKYFPYLRPVGIANTFENALELIDEHNPDIIIVNPIFDTVSIDDVFDKIDDADRKIIILTHNEKIIPKEFLLNYDLVKKPIKFSELLIAINNALSTILKIEAEDKFDDYTAENEEDQEEGRLGLMQKMTDLGAFKRISNAIVLSSLNEVLFLKKSDIMYFTAEGRYTTFHMNNSHVHIASRTMRDYEELLTEDNFIRIHNSFIINIDYLAKIIKKDGYIVELLDGTQLNVSRRRQEDLMNFLKFT